MVLNRARILLFLVALALLAAIPAKLRGTQTIKETILISTSLKDHLNKTKRLYRISHEMRRQARPFQKPRHRLRYRFAPSDKFGREIMSICRELAADFKVMNGMLTPVRMPERDPIFRRLLDITESLNVFAKRSIRAVRDGNHALYLASAQAVEKESSEMDILIKKLEIAINSSIEEADSLMEDL